MSEETDKIRKILDENADKDFVQRIIDPANSPSIDLGDGYEGTHLMAADIDEDTQRWLVYPTIVRIEGELKQLNVEEAFHHAKATGQYIDFGDKKAEAIEFSKNYKKVWEEE